MATNLWSNASIEYGVSDWNSIGGASFSQSITQAWENQNSLKIEILEGSDGARSDVKAASAETQYTLSFYVYTANASHAIDCRFLDQDNNNITTEYSNSFTASTWERVDLTGTTGVGDTGIKLEVRSNSGSAEVGDVFVDGIMLETGASASAWVDHISSATNLWSNASVEDGVDDWNVEGAGSISQSSDQKWHDTNSLYVVPGGQWQGAKSDTKSIVESSTEYTFSCFIRSTDGDMTTAVQVEGDVSGYIDQDSSATATDTWVRKTVTFTTGASDTGIVIKIVDVDATDHGNFYIDGIMLETGGSASEWIDYVESGTDIDATLGSLTLTGYDATISAGTGIDGTTGSLTLTGYDAAVGAGTAIAVEGPASGDGEWDMGAYIYPDASGGTFTLTGYNATVNAEVTSPIDATLGSFTLTGQNATISAGTDVDGTLGSLTLSGFDATVSAGAGINPGVGSFSLTGFNANVSAGSESIDIDANRIARIIFILK